MLAIAIACFISGCGSSGGANKAMTTPQPSGSCADPIILKGSDTLTDESTQSASDSISGEDPLCVGHETPGPDRVYKIALPASGNSKLSLKVVPSQLPGPEAFDPVIFATSDCVAKPICLTGADIHGGGSLESIEYRNASGQEQAIYIVVDGYGFQPAGGGYQLVSELSAP
jgi:hypothetical protein